MSTPPVAEIGIIGGSGLYRLIDGADRHSVDTPYGAPSDDITVAPFAGRNVAFLPRHGGEHTVPPHRINFRANIWALRSLGVSRVLAPCSAGSLRPPLAPGHMVIADQFLDRTQGRADTYFDGPEVAHLSAADPYCPELRGLAAAACTDAGITAHAQGTVAVIQGPRFATRAESRSLAAAGADIVNMTQYPEVVLARELGMCYVNLSLVTDYDTGVDGSPGVGPVTQEQVLAVFNENIDNLRRMLGHLVERLSEEPRCECHRAPRPF